MKPSWSTLHVRKEMQVIKRLSLLKMTVLEVCLLAAIARFALYWVCEYLFRRMGASEPEFDMMHSVISALLAALAGWLAWQLASKQQREAHIEDQVRNGLQIIRHLQYLAKDPLITAALAAVDVKFSLVKEGNHREVKPERINECSVFGCKIRDLHASGGDAIGMGNPSGTTPCEFRDICIHYEPTVKGTLDDTTVSGAADTAQQAVS